MSPILWALGALGALGLLGGAEVRRYERGVAKDISSRLGGKERRIEVRTRPRGLTGYISGNLSRATVFASHFETLDLPLFTEPQRPQDGRVGMFELRLTDFTLAGLRVESLTADIPDCQYDLHEARSARKIRLSKSGEGAGRVRLREKDLAAYALLKFPVLKRTEVRLGPEGVRLSGVADFLIFQGSFEIDGALAPRGLRQIAIQNARLTLNGKAVEAKTTAAILDRLNPIIDLDRDLHLHGAMDLQGVATTQGRVEAWGKARIPPKGEPVS